MQFHLLVVLKVFSSEGYVASALTVKQGLGLGKGSILKFYRRGVGAFLFLFYIQISGQTKKSAEKFTHYFSRLSQN